MQDQVRTVDVAVLRIKKLKGPGVLLAAQRHNLREIQAELGAGSSIDSRLTNNNVRLVGAALSTDVVARAKAMMLEAGVPRVRKDAVRGIEVLITLHAGTQVDVLNFFRACVPWMAQEFGGIENVLSVDVHRDEGAPHVHFIVLPLVEGRMVGSKLVGNRQALASLQARFFRDVSSGFGLSKPERPLSAPQRYEQACAVVDEIRRLDDPMTKSVLWPQLQTAIHEVPGVFADRLGLPAPVRKLRSSTAIFTGTGRGVGQAPHRQGNSTGSAT